jgi:hypothetical protein
VKRSFVRHLLAPFAAAALVAVAGCNNASPHPVPPPYVPPSTPPSPSAVNGLSDLPQDLALLPGERNLWDLDRDFTLADGGDGQFAGAVQLNVGIPNTTPTADQIPADFNQLAPMPFVLDQAELSFTSPVVPRGAAQLSAVAATNGFPNGNALRLAGSLGLPTAGGNAVPTRLSQAIDLRAVAAPLSLSWRQYVLVFGGLVPGGPAPAWRVRIHDTAGALLVEAFSTGATELVAADVAPVDVSAAAGQQVTLDFELLGSPGSLAVVDDVKLLDGAATDHVVNGGFAAAGLAPWTVTGPDQPCQVVAAAQVVGGLKVVRQFMARPENRWGRFIDTYENTSTTATVTTEANYLHVLGASTEAVIQPSAGGKAVSAWDASGFTPARRDVALVFGTTTLPPVYRSTTVPAAGSPYVWTRFPLTLAPLQKKVVVHFVVLTEARTGDTAADLSAHATTADAEAAAIASGFWSDADYREGMTAAQEAALVNF